MAPTFARKSARSLPGTEEWPGTHWRRTWSPEEQRKDRADQREKTVVERRVDGWEERVERQERESEQRIKEVKEQEDR